MKKNSGSREPPQKVIDFDNSVLQLTAGGGDCARDYRNVKPQSRVSEREEAKQVVVHDNDKCRIHIRTD